MIRLSGGNTQSRVFGHRWGSASTPRGAPSSLRENIGSWTFSHEVDRSTAAQHIPAISVLPSRGADATPRTVGSPMTVDPPPHLVHLAHVPRVLTRNDCAVHQQPLRQSMQLD